MACYYIDVSPFAGRRKIEPVDNEPATCSRPPYGGLGDGNGSGEGDGSGSAVSRPPDVSPTPSYIAPPSITPFPKAGTSDSGTVQSTATPGSSSSSSSSSTSAVCIDAKLVEASGHQQVYRTHRSAEVFCDISGSCATAGHIVVFNGKIMMMSKYCQQADGGCQRRTMKVNSPQMGSNVRVKTHTVGLEMTALAARFCTRTEELILRAFVHFGA